MVMTMIYFDYQSLNDNRNAVRARLDANKPTPAAMKGSLFTPHMEQMKPAEFMRHGVHEWTRLAMAMIVSASDEIGWDEYLNMLFEKQRPVIEKKARAIANEYDLDASNMMEAYVVIFRWAIGCGFEALTNYSTGPDEIVEAADSCPQIAAMNEMKMGERADKLSFWCDTMDNMIIQTENPNIYYTHTNCLGRPGDAHCRTCVKEHPGDVKQDSYFATIEKIRNTLRKNEDDNGIKLPDIEGHIHFPRFLESWTPEQIAADGVEAKGNIGQENMLLAAITIGWERFIDIICNDLGPGLESCAEEKKELFRIKGDSLQDAANLAMIGYAMLGFYDHNVVEYTDKRVELVARKCPIIDAAYRLGVQDKIENVSLWCDFYHNHHVNAVDPSSKLTHSNCLGRGDEFCRVVIEKK